MQIFLDAASRVFRAAAPDGTPLLDPSLVTGTVDLVVSDDDWSHIYYPAWNVATAAGQDLVIDVFGGYAIVTHMPTPRERAISTLLAFPATGTTTLDQADDAIRALIILLELSGQLSGLVVPLVIRIAPPIRQVLRRATRARSRSYLVGASSPSASSGQRAQLTRSVNRKPPLQHRRGRPN